MDQEIIDGLEDQPRAGPDEDRTVGESSDKLS